MNCLKFPIENAIMLKIIQNFLKLNLMFKSVLFFHILRHYEIFVQKLNKNV